MRFDKYIKQIKEEGEANPGATTTPDVAKYEPNLGAVRRRKKKKRMFRKEEDNNE